MKNRCLMVPITIELQEYIEDKCYFLDLGLCKCKWMQTK
jgi:hypothetical protein